ncbi:MAG: class I SAM-dependent methyltransferase [Dysgonomonas sp.]
MPRIYRFTKIGSIILSKVLHHNGHGVHSPFVFSLITKVIGETSHYYAYKDIRNYLQKQKSQKRGDEKYDRLVFRLVNHFKAQNILELGSGSGLTSLYATAPSGKTVCYCVELSEKKRKYAESLYRSYNRKIVLQADLFTKTEEKKDCIIVNLDNYPLTYEWFYEHLFPLCSEKTFIILKGIRTKRQNQVLWRKLKRNQSISVSIDMFNTGILFFNKKLYKRNYRLNF